MGGLAGVAVGAGCSSCAATWRLGGRAGRGSRCTRRAARAGAEPPRSGAAVLFPFFGMELPVA